MWDRSSCAAPRWSKLDAIKDKISEEDYKRTRYVIGEEKRVLMSAEALEKGDYETVGERMYETHWGMSKDYEVCREVGFPGWWPKSAV